MTRSIRLNRRALTAAGVSLLAVLGPVGLVGLGAGPAGAAVATTADLYVLHAVADVSADIAVDSKVVKAAAPSTSIVGPIKVSAGAHVITLHPSNGSADITATINAVAGTSVDVVAHSQADPTAAPVLTVFPNDLSAVASDKARLVVAHTAAVPPADIRVNGSVLFSNVANGEALTVLVPGGSYSVDVVPTATTGPVVFGPVDLTVTAGALNRVFAFGNPQDGTMNAIVQVLDLTTSGSGPPGSVDTGNGGQASTSTSRPAGAPISAGLVLMSGMGLAVAALVVRVRSTRASAVRRG